MYDLFLSLWEAAAAAAAAAATTPTCPCCGVQLTTHFQQQATGSDRQAHPTNASPDRLDNTKEYLADNVRLTCVACNMLRQDSSIRGVADHVARLKTAWRSGSWKLQDGFLSSVAPIVAPTSRDLQGIE